MTQEELHNNLVRLHQELAQTQKLDAQSIQSLRILAQDIQNLLDQTATSENPESELSTDSSLSARIRDAIEQFEARHPQLTNTLSTIAERLSDMGI